MDTAYCHITRDFADSEIGRRYIAVRRTTGSLPQRYLGNCLWWLLRQRRCHSCLQEPWHRVSALHVFFVVEWL